MSLTKSAKKALRQNLKRRLWNERRKRKIKSLQKEIVRALQASNIEKAKELLPLFYKAVDKAVKRNTIKENKGNRLKAKIAKLVSSYASEHSN